VSGPLSRYTVRAHVDRDFRTAAVCLPLLLHPSKSNLLALASLVACAEHDAVQPEKVKIEIFPLTVLLDWSSFLHVLHNLQLTLLCSYSKKV